MNGPRNRASMVLRVVAALSLAVVIAVAIATSRRSTDTTTAIETPRIEDAPDSSPPPEIESIEAPDSRVAVRALPAARPVSPAPKPPGDPSRRPPPPVPNGVRIFGEVRDAAGRLIPDAVAHVECETEGGTRSDWVRGSAYRIEGILPGSAALTCRAQGYRDRFRRIELLPGETQHREDFVLDPGWLVDVEIRTASGRRVDPLAFAAMFPEGSPRFTVSPTPPPDRFAAGSLESRRGHRLAAEVAGNRNLKAEGVFARLRIDADPPLFLNLDVRNVVIASTRLESDVDRARLDLQVASLAAFRSSFTCILLDRETNQAFPRVFATLSGRGLAAPARLEADPAGRVQRGGLLPGRYSLSIRGVTTGAALTGDQAPSADAWSARTIRSFDLEPGLATDLGTIWIDRAQHFSGRFVDERGRPAEGHGLVRPAVLDDGSEWFDEVPGISLSEKPSGRFTCDGLGKERYVLVAWGRPAAEPKSPTLVRTVLVDLGQGSVDDLVVELRHSYSVFIRPASEETKDYLYRIADADGVQFVRGVLSQRKTYWLAPGKYAALVGPDADHLREIPFRLGTEPLTIPVEP